jgi:hypothetical protein
VSERGAARLAGTHVPGIRHGDAGRMAASGARSAHSGQRALGMRSPSAVVAVPRVGLVFPSRLPFGAWQGIGTNLAVAASSSAWCLGDWLVYGQAAYAGRYRAAVERTGLDYQTLRNYAWVARRFGLCRRRERLSFGHHAEVAALPEPEQDFWLRKAEELGWGVMRLRREVRASLAEREDGPAELESVGVGRCGGRPQERRLAVIRVALTPGQRALCERAAGQDGEDLHAWAARALERAASKQLAAPS